MSVIGRFAAVGATLAMLVTGATTVAAASPAAASTKIGPNQFFSGLVNGKRGRLRPVTIHMACFGAIKPGQEGHPMAGQTVEVIPASGPADVAEDVGFTGPKGNEVGAFFGALPPSPPSTSGGAVIFGYYGVMKAIPTTELLPCAGAGTISFVPLPVLPGGSIADVHVVFVGQP
jgi:hypothetical protein